MKMKIKKKNRPHRYDRKRPRFRHGHKYSKYKRCLGMMMLMRSKQQLSNIWSSIYAKVKQHWSWVGKKRCLKKTCILIGVCTWSFLSVMSFKKNSLDWMVNDCSAFSKKFANSSGNSTLLLLAMTSLLLFSIVIRVAVIFLSEGNGFIVFKNCLLSVTFFTSGLLKYRSLSFLYSLLQFFLFLVYFKVFFRFNF